MEQCNHCFHERDALEIPTIQAVEESMEDNKDFILNFANDARE